jgi:hypothetical protein
MKRYILSVVSSIGNALAYLLILIVAETVENE